MSENSTVSSIVAEVVIMAGVITIVYVGGKAAKKIWKTGSAMKTARFSKVKP